MSISKKLVLAAMVAGAFVASATRQAEATPIVSPPGTVLLSDIASHPSYTYSMLVGDITFWFDSCAGNGCTSGNNEILGVPASAATGPGGGIIIQPASDVSNTVLPAPGKDNPPNDITLKWYASTTGNKITGATGQVTGGGATGTGNAAGGGVSLFTDGATSLGTLTMTTTSGPVSKPFPNLVNNVSGTMDISSTGTGYLNSGQVFLSEVPEPASLALLLTALGGLGYLRRRHRSA